VTSCETTDFLMFSYKGSKRRFKKLLYPFFPKDYDCYYEPFLGSGAMLYHLKPKHAVVGDVSPDVINFHRCVQCHWDAFWSFIGELDQEGDLIRSMSAEQQKRWFCQKVADLNATSFLDPVSRAGLFAVVMQSVYGASLRYDVDTAEVTAPFGGDVRPLRLVDISRAHKYLQTADVTFVLGNWTETLKGCTQRDVVYLDPPYFGLSDYSGSFLYSRLVSAVNLKAKVVMSEAKTDVVVDLFGDWIRLEYPNNGGLASELTEVVITNFVKVCSLCAFFFVTFS
jgi:DNA adenine methylase